MAGSKRSSTRRDFLLRSGAATIASFATPLTTSTARAAAGPMNDVQAAGALDVHVGPKRKDRAYEIRQSAAMYHKNAAAVRQNVSGDEERYQNRIASFTKSLPHSRNGEVEPQAYERLLRAVKSGNGDDFEEIPLGGLAKLADPLAAYSYVLEGGDPHQFTMDPPPAFASLEQAGEMAELYWQALLRDVPFSEYGSHSIAIAAAEDLSRFPQFKPAGGGTLDPKYLFRGPTRGDRLGPYVSQFLLKDIQYGTRRLDQKIRTTVPGDDYLVNYASWLAVQNGGASGANRLDLTLRHILTGRDLAEFVHQDFTYQAFLDAALILLTMRVPFDSRNPYRNSVTQSGFGTFGGPHVLDLVARVSSCALKACWAQKWLVHRRLRPEEFGARVHNTKTGAAAYPIHEALLTSPVLDAVSRRHTSYLLPQAYPEGAPMHPSYPAGHAAIAGACATALKAVFHEPHVIAEPVMPSSTGLAIVPYSGYDRLTVGGELDKLASNIAFGRNIAGVHYLSDGIGGLKLGEEVALSVLRDMKDCFTQLFRGFSLTRFDGTTITV
jgi:membrane-associated phospholipid phosphatase